MGIKVTNAKRSQIIRVYRHFNHTDRYCVMYIYQCASMHIKLEPTFCRESVIRHSMHSTPLHSLTGYCHLHLYTWSIFLAVTQQGRHHIAVALHRSAPSWKTIDAYIISHCSSSSSSIQQLQQRCQGLGRESGGGTGQLA